MSEDKILENHNEIAERIAGLQLQISELEDRVKSLEHADYTLAAQYAQLHYGIHADSVVEFPLNNYSEAKGLAVIERAQFFSDDDMRLVNLRLIRITKVNNSDKARFARYGGSEYANVTHRQADRSRWDWSDAAKVRIVGFVSRVAQDKHGATRAYLVSPNPIR